MEGRTQEPERARGTADRHGWLRPAGKVVVSAGLFAALAFMVDWAEVASTMRYANYGLLALAMMPLAIAIPLSALRWRLCGHAAGLDIPLPYWMRATYSALFAGQILPAGVGADAVRMGYLLYRKAKVSRALQSLIMDRLVGVVGMVVMMALGLPLIWARLPQLLRALAVLMPMGVCAGLLVLWALPKIGLLTRYAGVGKRKKLIDLSLSVRASILSLDLAKALVLSMGIYAGTILSVYWIAASLSVQVPYGHLVAVVSIALFLSLIPVSINGWGVREGAMVVGLAALGVQREAALITSLLLGAGTALATLPGAFLWHVKGMQAEIDRAVHLNDE